MNNNTALPNDDSQVTIYLPFVIHIPLYTGRVLALAPSFYIPLPYVAPTSQITHLSPALAPSYYHSLPQITRLSPPTNAGPYAWGPTPSNSSSFTYSNVTGLLADEESGHMGWTHSLSTPATSLASSSFQAPVPVTHHPQSNDISRLTFSSSTDHGNVGVLEAAGSESNTWSHGIYPLTMAPATYRQEMTQPSNDLDIFLAPLNQFALSYSEPFPNQRQLRSLPTRVAPIPHFHSLCLMRTKEL
ncbi:hypothetical protein M413DRAFT_345661 [Hebeloma cylindrosporum]|uniref:Uncharacterized protein n=1 Tax=Hebeloma cylindrosporum TaxID=76867 RepID=A0A0C2YXK2_HEBCY|nr:hypothetical protein M413DRAFT_345661 [Hebeloma cylindrosporum h7]